MAGDTAERQKRRREKLKEDRKLQNEKEKKLKKKKRVGILRKINVEHIWPDGPSSQFKNQYVASALPALKKKI